MDAIVTTQNLKKRKLPDGQNNNGTEDRISCLPDSILLCILSLLPTKFAVLTSALSRRWMYLWTSVPNLDFSEDTPADSKVFMNFVDRVLLLNDSSNIHRFRLLCSDRLDASRINAWIFTAIKRKVQELILEIGVKDPWIPTKMKKDPCIFPRSLFTCDTLVKLQIHKTDLKLPPLIHLSCLKVLHLTSNKLLCDLFTKQVSFTLPMLKKFFMESCKSVGINTIRIFSPALETWILSNPKDTWFDSCEIQVYAESLRYLYLRSSLACNLSLFNLSSLATASIDVSFAGRETGHVSKLLRAVCNVKELTLSESSVGVLARADVFADWLMFTSLVHLKVVYKFLARPDTGRVGQLIDLLCHLTNVEHFCLSSDPNSFELRDDKYGWAVEANPKANLLHLKTVTVKYFHGSKNELYLVGVLLKIARALETMTIISSPELLKFPKRQMEAAKRLLSLPRDSTCVINFS